MKIENQKITVRLANKDDIQQVKELLERYHVKNLESEQRENGFVTTDMTEEQLIALCESEQGVIIAIEKDNNNVIGLLLGASWQFLKKWPMFDYMTSILNEYSFQNKRLDAITSYQYGPICIAEEFRGHGVGELLLACQRRIFAERYPVAVTFVNVLNPRSYAFHSRNKFVDVGLFHFNGNKYHMMAIPTSD